MAALTEEADAFPIVVIVSGKLMRYSPTGMMGGKEVADCMEVLRIENGCEAHWLRFVASARPECVEATSLMLKAEDLQNIIEALGQDITEYARDVRRDQEHVEKHIQPAIQDFLIKLRGEGS